MNNNDTVYFGIAITVMAVMVITLGMCGLVIYTFQKPEKVSAMTIDNADYDTGILHIYLHESLVTGTDQASYAAALIINQICETGWKVHIMNDWVPSRKNPIDLEWSRILVSKGES